MKVPAGYTEAEVLASIEKIVNSLAPSFTFGYFDVEDIKQEGRFEALKVLEEEKFDETRKLDNFLYTHIRNRYINLRRNKFKRSDPPCIKCHEGRPCGEDNDFCQAYAEWFKRNSAKANIARPLDIDHISDENEKHTREESEVHEQVEVEELKRIIDERLPVEYRAIYLQMQSGVVVPKVKRLQVEKLVREIVGGVLPNIETEEE